MKAFVLEETTIAEVHQHMQAGTLTCRELVDAYLDRIEAYDQNGPQLNTIISLNPNVQEEADELDRKFCQSGLSGSLHGIPVMLKDNIDTCDMATTGGSLSLAGHTPKDDAFLVTKLREAGAIILAKVNLHEFAIWGETISSVLGQTLNPYDLTRTPGGSSGGTGAAIAANFALVGIGTDTVNSIRSPSSANSLVGIRPTLGLVSRGGIIPYSLTQDTAGPLCRTVEDTLRVLTVIAGYDQGDDETAWSVGKNITSEIISLGKDSLQQKRIGVLECFFGGDSIHTETNDAVKISIEKMSNLGSAIVPLNKEIDADYLVDEVSVHLHELKKELDSYLGALQEKPLAHSLQDIFDSGRYHKGIEDNILKALALHTGMANYHRRLWKRQQLQTQVMKLFADYDLDAIVYPHQKQLVCKVGGSQMQRNGVLAAITGFPSICVQAGFATPTSTAPIGIPIGLEFLGRPFSEAALIQMAYSFEQATLNRKPPVIS